jgi:hypothetical protein
MVLVFNDDLDAGQASLVGNHFNQLGVRDGDKLLIVEPTDLDVLLPALVVADNQEPST